MLVEAVELQTGRTSGRDLKELGARHVWCSCPLLAPYRVGEVRWVKRYTRRITKPQPAPKARASRGREKLGIPPCQSFPHHHKLHLLNTCRPLFTMPLPFVEEFELQVLPEIVTRAVATTISRRRDRLLGASYDRRGLISR